MIPENRQTIYRAIDEEKARQDVKFGDQADNTWFKWLAILTEEVGEAAEAMLDLHQAVEPEDVRREIVRLKSELTRIAAVSVHCLERMEGW